MKKQLYLIIMLLIVGLFSVIMGFMFDAIESMKFIDANATLIYWLGKGISLGLLVVVAIYLIAKKGDAGNTYILGAATILFQLMPLLLRVVLMGSKPSFIWAALIGFVCLIAYIGLFFILDISNDQFKKAEKNLQGKTVEVKDYDNEDGTFKGA